MNLSAWQQYLSFAFIQKILFVYIGITIFVYFLSDWLIFQPPASTYRDNAQIIKLSVGKKKISAIYLNNKNATYTVLYSHGNAEDLGMIYPFLTQLYQLGFSVLSYDYQGYGTSEGSPSEGKTYLDILSAYQFLVGKQKIDPNRIIVFGRSIGTGPSLELASKRQVGGLILEAPFLTTFRVITHFPLFVVDKFRNNSKIPNVNVPILIMHGDQDEVIPFWHGKTLAQEASQPVDFYKVAGAHHNDMIAVAGDTYWHRIIQYVNQLKK